MKLFAVAAIAIAALTTVNAASESTLHIRVHAADDNEKDHQWTPTVPEWGQCKFYGKPLSACASGTLCREQDAYYGQCIREPANLYGQCGGKGWTGNCSSGKCTRTSEYYAQCTPK